MTIVPEEAETRIATLKRPRPDLLEIHYKAGHVFVTEDISEVQEKRRSMMGTRPYATLTIIPKGMDFDLDSMRVDHGGGDRTQGQIIATAIVAHDKTLERLTHVYMKYFPHMQHVLITSNEADARAWVEEQLKGATGTGS
ncbi:MAG: hypothetical protein JNM62_13855 [Flavobacteriales bacterium]|nr:hypothetical protein [Flavobacteriales bacterium]